MKLSILDQAPIELGGSPQEALGETIKLAALGERLGYHRYWIAEHHDLNGLACPAPEVMLGTIGAHTKSIRIGSGAVLLPHYKPFKIAETFNLLATLYPDRIDLGIGRSPGGSAEASIALSGNFLENVKKMPELLEELLHFLNSDFESSHMYANIKPTPIPAISPDIWLLGTSEKSAILAAEKGMPYAFGHFMSDQDPEPIIQAYKQWFKEKYPMKRYRIIVAVQVICADSMQEAELIARKNYLTTIDSMEDKHHLDPVPKIRAFSPEESAEFLTRKKKMIIGDPSHVKERLVDLQHSLGVDEFMVLTNTTTYKERNRSFKLIANAILEK
ncbi:LLM class flavin-dependent oxidoreductase [Ornithinibacillus xuwenensis]|uniref:LLM class flavin-dependent oxidoreductase n=1 Tax=Ornithinibacillus xuwenensis TaxID=3144668 RepID=A0ABU9XJE3_9BACI